MRGQSPWSPQVCSYPACMLPALSVSESPLAVSSQWDGSVLSPPPTHTDQAEDKASEWWGHLPLSYPAPPWTRHPVQVSFLQHVQVSTLPCASGPACLLAFNHPGPHPGPV